MSEALLASTPEIRPDVTMGPAKRLGPKVVHYLKDTAGDGYLATGPRELFLISRLDGKHSLAEIGEAYSAEYDRSLSAPQWQQLLGLLAYNGLLVDGPPPADRGARTTRSSLFYRRMPLFDPDQLLGVLDRRLGFLFRPATVWIEVALGLVVLGFVISNAAELAADFTSRSFSPMFASLAVVTSWLIMVLHELAHGLTCRHFGGRVREIGLLWRFPLFAPYCNADDVMLFASRRQAIYTALAGTLTQLLTLAPFTVAWTMTASPWRGFFAVIVLIGTLVTLFNLVPFLPLDGYYMLNHALGMADLRGQARIFVFLWFRRVRGDTKASVQGYSRRDRWIYGSYAACSSAFLLGLLAGVIGWIFYLLRSWFGSDWLAACVLAVACAALLGIRLLKRAVDTPRAKNGHGDRDQR
ncbi:metalloprotease [Amycolatopsis circi]|uniref:metalloprotease n=1 Tax=Amycolatopsis circi TaxID=871959 RepID=UPI0013BEA575|nr:M50 family metallopeptidase [Amycolatopsis circi]